MNPAATFWLPNPTTSLLASLSLITSGVKSLSLETMQNPPMLRSVSSSSIAVIESSMSAEFFPVLTRLWRPHRMACFSRVVAQFPFVVGPNARRCAISPYCFARLMISSICAAGTVSVSISIASWFFAPRSDFASCVAVSGAPPSSLLSAPFRKCS